ncbi:hypothetical protein [Fimbriimonas ginsengisoli]|uniref:Uncharacterized protein n=1 Tax=Fimbriimonas ginsengisoli Gsoil 348 TaxID=661478 RepID=A0A068NS74_FIMGI|nr:hypothetical protein [Fimbriimonas ginsengisoli]AIE85590.1 hypothetical protein OP10G_2222 [Fimbriimonas ginsengisoli Gsoil 348]
MNYAACLGLLAALSSIGSQPTNLQATAQEPVLEVEGVAGTIRMRNFTRSHVDAISGETIMTGVGNPVVVEDTGTGLTLIAKSMSCRLKQNDKGEYVVQQATLADGAQVLIDSSVAAKSATERAKRENKPAPAAPKETTKTRIDSDSIVYVLNEQEGVMTFPKPVEYSGTSDGRATKTQDNIKVEVPFTQLTKASGSKGRFTIHVPLSAGDPVEARTGHLDGLVKFSLVRSETPAPKAGVPVPPEVTTVNGVGDSFDADFVKEGDPTLTLTGNVKLDGAGKAFKGSVTGTQAIFTLDRLTRQVTGYEFVGQPATTRINTKVGGR